MQRRAAALYVAFFVIVGAGAYGLLATAAQPEVTLDGPSYGVDDTLTVEDRTYRVSDVGADSGELVWRNESARFTATVENDTELTRDNETYRASTRPNASELVLVEQRNLTALLRADDQVRNETTTVDGVEHVVLQDGETIRPVTEHFGPPRTVTYAVGNDSYPYENRTVTVSNVTADAATLTWTDVRENTISLSEGTNVTLGDRQYFAHFSDGDSVSLLSSEDRYGEYQQQLAAVDSYQERMNGLRGVVIVSGAAAVLMLAMAYLPTRR